MAALAFWVSPLAAQDTIPLAFEVKPKVAPDLSRDPRVPWLRKHAVPVRTVDPGDDDFRDLEPLRKAIGDAQVVILGEGSHGDGTTFLAKTRLIKFLHQRMGFDVLAMEAGFYGMAKSWEKIQQGEDPRTAMDRGLFRQWADVAEFQPLFQYIGAQARTKRPLEVAGVDPQLTGTASRDLLAADLKAFLEKIGVETAALNEGTPFRKALEGLSNLGGYTPPEPEFLDTLAVLQQQVESKADRSNPETTFWLRVMDGIRQQAYDLTQLKVIAKTQPEQTMAGRRHWLARDDQMGRNIAWMAEAKQPNRKVIVWSHISHAQYGGFEPRNRPWELDWRPMGAVAREVLGKDKLYVIGFTPYQGSSHHPLWAGKGWPTRRPVKNTPDAVEFEDLMHAIGWEYAFVDLRRPAEGGEWLKEPMWARPWNAPQRTEVAELMDGLLYMRELEPLTKAPE